MKANTVETKSVRTAVVEDSSIATNAKNDIAENHKSEYSGSLVEVQPEFKFGSLLKKVTKTVTQAKDNKNRKWIMDTLFGKKQIIEWKTKCLKGCAVNDIKCFSDMFLNNPEELDNFYLNREIRVSKIMEMVSRIPELSIEFFSDPDNYNMVVRPSPEFIGDYIEENYLKSGKAFKLWEALYHSMKCSEFLVKMILEDHTVLRDYNIFVEFGVSLDNVIKTAIERGYQLIPFVFEHSDKEGGYCGLRAERLFEENSLPVELAKSASKKLFSDMTNDEKLVHVADLCGDHSHCQPAIANTKSGWMFEYKDIENKDYFHIFKSQTVDYTKEDWFTYQATVAEIKSFAQGTGLFVWHELESPGKRHPFNCVTLKFSDKLVKAIVPSMLKEGAIYPVKSKGLDNIFMWAVLEFFNGKRDRAPGYVEKFIFLDDFVKIAKKHGYAVKPYHMEKYDRETSLGYVVVTKQKVNDNEPKKSLGNKVTSLFGFIKK